MSLDQTDIDRLAGQVSRLTMVVNGVGQRLADQENLLQNIQARMTSELSPVIDSLNAAFQKSEAVGQKVMEVVREADDEVAEMADSVQEALLSVLDSPPVAESLEIFDQAIATAEEVNTALNGRLTELTEIVESAEADVFSALDTLSDKSVELTGELLDTLIEEAAALTAKMAEAVFGTIREAIENMTDTLQSLASEKISEVLNSQIERLAAEVTEQFAKVLAFLRESIDDLMDKIAEQLQADTENEQSARAVLEDAVAPLEPLMDQVKQAYSAFQSLADTAGVPLPDLG